MNNSLNETTLPEAFIWVRISGAVSFIFLSFSGIILNCILATILYKGRNSFQKNAFFTITWQILAFDLMNHIVAFLVAIPLTLIGENFYGASPFYLIVCAFETFSYTGTLLLSFIMTLNRVTVFILPAINRFLFQKCLFWVIGLAWLVNIAFVATWNGFGCYKDFNTGKFYYEHVCPVGRTVGQRIHMTFVSTTTWLPVVMFLTYIVMLIYIKFKLDFRLVQGKLVRRQVAGSAPQINGSNLKMEFQLLAQAFLICGFLEVETIVFNLAPRIQAEGQWAYLISFIGTDTGLALSCVHPLILFIFNGQIRGQLGSFYKNPTRFIASATISSVVHPI